MAQSIAGRSRRWCLTIFQSLEQDGAGGRESMAELRERACQTLSDAGRRDGLTRAIFQEEAASTTSRKHLQMYLEFAQTKSPSQIGHLFPGAHRDISRGTPQQAWDYCCKEDTRRDGTEPWTIGERPRGQGKRTDYDTARSTIRDGIAAKLSDETIQDNLYESSLNLWATGRNSLGRIMTQEHRLAGSAPRAAPEVIILYGKTGTGKTRWVWENHPTVFPVPLSPKGTPFWADGYQGQPKVLLDEMPWEGLSLQLLLQLLDRYPLQVPVKGGFTAWKPTKIFLTSNLHPDEWYPGALPAHVAALMRRVGGIREMKHAQVQSGALWTVLDENMVAVAAVPAAQIPSSVDYFNYGN